MSTERYGHKGFTSFQQGQGDLKALLFYWILLSPRHIQNIKFRQVNLKSVSNLTRNDFDCGKNCYVYVKPIIASSIRSFYFSKLSFNKQVEVWGAIAYCTPHKPIYQCWCFESFQLTSSCDLMMLNFC